VPNFKLWHDPDPTNCRTKVEVLPSANSLTQRNHFGNEKEFHAMMISKVRPVQARIPTDQKEQGPLIFAEMKADPEEGNHSERLRSERALEISDPVISPISANPEANLVHGPTVEIAGRKNHLERVTPKGLLPIAIATIRIEAEIIHLIRDQKGQPGLRNPLVRSIAQTASGKKSHLEKVGPLPMDMLLIDIGRTGIIHSHLAHPDRPVSQRNPVREVIPIRIVNTARGTIVNKSPFGNQSKNRLFNPGLLSREIL
jgi:hypothetical protein